MVGSSFRRIASFGPSRDRSRRSVEDGNTLPEMVISELEKGRVPAWVIESLR